MCSSTRGWDAGVRYSALTVSADAASEPLIAGANRSAVTSLSVQHQVIDVQAQARQQQDEAAAEGHGRACRLIIGDLDQRPVSSAMKNEATEGSAREIESERQQGR